jgi:hypothetical protein
LNENIRKSIERLKLLGEYEIILRKLEVSGYQDLPILFEALFADALTISGTRLIHEFNANPFSEKTIDFLYQAQSGEQVFFELIRPEPSDELRNQYEHKMYKEGVLLSSDYTNEFLRPEAQTLRIQEKILGKVEKFPEPDEMKFSTIVVDCSNFHFGHFDDEDARIVMYGKPKSSILTEYWQGTRVQGLLEKTNKLREIPDFQRKVTSVIFVQDIYAPSLLNGARIVFNSTRTEQHKLSFKNMLSSLLPSSDLIWLDYDS